MTKQETTELPVAGADDDKDKFLNDSESCLVGQLLLLLVVLWLRTVGHGDTLVTSRRFRFVVWC